MSKIKLPVDSLRLGMYVAELDRPWIETPFLFQGFILEREDDIRELGRYCRHVFVDNERSLTPVEGSGRAEGQATEATDIKRAEPITADRERFISVARESADHREMTHDYLRHAFRDVRLGGAPEPGYARSVGAADVEETAGCPDVRLHDGLEDPGARSIPPVVALGDRGRATRPGAQQHAHFGHRMEISLTWVGSAAVPAA
jgi:hypothetical protein